VKSTTGFSVNGGGRDIERGRLEIATREAAELVNVGGRDIERGRLEIARREAAESDNPNRRLVK
jgi:hypothetical protein